MHNNQTLANQKAIEVNERQRQAVELRKAGVGFQRIADQLGYKDASGAYRAVRAALKKTLQEPADEVRKLELERLDVMLFGIWTQVRQGNQGAIDRALKIAERRAKILGLDAPTKAELTGKDGGPIEHSVDDDAARYIADLIARGVKGAAETSG